MTPSLAKDDSGPGPHRRFSLLCYRGRARYAHLLRFVAPADLIDLIPAGSTIALHALFVEDASNSKAFHSAFAL